MRINLREPLKAGGQYSFSIKWDYKIQNRIKLGGRSGFEYFPEDDNRLYSIAQFFPRMCVYDAMTGWQTKQYLGDGEFALEFGDFDVSITVPSDFVIAATGELNNPQEVLTARQLERFEEARLSGRKVVIISEEEARKQNPNYFLVLPWYFINEFVERERNFLTHGGKFIVPLPYFKVIDLYGKN